MDERYSKNRQSSYKQPDQAALEAAGWVTSISMGDITPEEMTIYADWLREAPTNVQKYLENVAIWEALGNIDPEGKIEIEHEPAAESNVIDLPLSQVGVQRPAPAGYWSKCLALAACLVVTVATAWFWWKVDPDSSLQVATELGKQKSLALLDGSTVKLNTLTKLNLEQHKFERRVELISGEAYFEVVKDPDRPFIVSVSNVEVEVLGTRFNVRKDQPSTLITLVEGSVSVRHKVDKKGDRAVTVLTPGQQAKFSEPDKPVQTFEVDTEKVLAWTKYRIVFENDTLEYIVEEFNRYNPQRLIIATPKLESIRLTGVFEANDVDSFLTYLAQIEDIVVREHDGGIRTIQSREVRSLQ